MTDDPAELLPELFELMAVDPLETVRRQGSVVRSAGNGRLTALCEVCRKTETAPDKGLGRAKLAAWESRHGVNCGH